MKRNKIIKKPLHHHIKKIKPFFYWEFCRKCGLEFRREFGWKFYNGYITSVMDVRNYNDFIVCGTCCPTKEDVVHFRQTLIERKPAIPPSGPEPKLNPIYVRKS